MEETRQQRFPWKLLYQIVMAAALLSLVALASAQMVNFHVADLGRHIMNGKIFLEQGFPITTNHYSYTQTNFPATNHHWGAGVIYYWLEQATGFSGLSVLNISLLTLGVLCFFMVAWKIGGFPLALLTGILSVPLVTDRIEIRPEMFSNFFLGIEFLILYLFKLKKIRLKHLIVLPVIQLVWVNVHIFFVMGLFTIGVFMVDYWLEESSKRRFWQAASVVLVSTVACLINPFHIHGLIEPFTIFEEYGYMVAENQSIFFMQDRFGSFEYLWFEILFGASAISFIPMLLKKQWKTVFLPLVFWLVFGALSFKMVRNMPIFGMFFIPVVSLNVSFALKLIPEKKRQLVEVAVVGIAIVLLLVSFNKPEFPWYPYKQNTGLGLLPGSLRAAGFFQQLNSKGKIFNNYDIGGYLIYNLFPKRKVFVDNRPEAYSVKFFKEVYNPMQEHEDVWKRIDERYRFNSIFFYRHDMTPHAQPFLLRRLDDPNWAPVYVDDFCIIFLRRDGTDQRLIEQYELPEDMFRSVPGDG